MGFCGGQVYLKKDPNLSRSTSNVLQDVSMGGAKARRFLSNHDNKQVNAMWNCLKDPCIITTNIKSRPNVSNKHMGIWQNLDNVLKVLRQQVGSKTYGNDFKKAIKLLINVVTDAWG